MKRPVFNMLVGLPGSGKSTYLKKAWGPEVVVLSTDNFIEARAKELGKTYTEIFSDTIKEAEADLWEKFAVAKTSLVDMVVDRTNMTVRGRQRFLSQLPSVYQKVAFVFMVPADVLAVRLTQRPGKDIPQNVIASMMASYVPPTKAEGFDTIFDVPYEQGSLN